MRPRLESGKSIPLGRRGGRASASYGQAMRAALLSKGAVMKPCSLNLSSSELVSCGGTLSAIVKTVQLLKVTLQLFLFICAALVLAELLLKASFGCELKQHGMRRCKSCLPLTPCIDVTSAGPLQSRGLSSSQ
eukprot:613252-Amphidinium_carterae.1